MMIENNLQVNSISYSPLKEITPQKSMFDEFFQAALNIFNDTNNLQLRTEKLQQDFATGKSDDILSVMMAQERAYSSLQFTVSVTNKIVEAYREIMRMQV